MVRIVTNLKLQTSQLKQLATKVTTKIKSKITQQPEVNNIWFSLWQKAAQETADYVEKNMLTLPYFRSRRNLMKLALSKVQTDGLYLEFGCGWQAKSINFLAKQIPGDIHGFDSFEGLPDDWFGNLGKKSFSAHGRLPIVRDNVQIHAGWFDKTLPEFVEKYPSPVAFLHIDCDIYVSTKTVFDWLGDRIHSGTVIQFDEYFNYPGWQQHEYKAFQEFITQKQLTYQYLGYCNSGFSVAVIIT